MIISNHYHLPLQEVVDWKEFSIIIPESEVSAFAQFEMLFCLTNTCFALCSINFVLCFFDVKFRHVLEYLVILHTDSIVIFSVDDALWNPGFIWGRIVKPPSAGHKRRPVGRYTSAVAAFFFRVFQLWWGSNI